jgi:hypothetical protein
VEVTPESYCRELEAYLCRKNDGHLVRIVGPAFEQVCTWAARGVPLKIAQRGIDRYFERYYARGPRRRPVRIEFCEADVLDVFDEWRRAVGVPAPPAADTVRTLEGPTGADAASPDEESATSRHGSLPSHLERVVARLTVLRGGADRRLDTVLEAIVAELDAARAAAKRLRGPAREAFVQRLAELDRALIDAARAQCEAATLQRLAAEADAELAPFRSRMPGDAYERSRAVCIERALRDLLRLPAVAYE